MSAGMSKRRRGLTAAGATVVAGGLVAGLVMGGMFVGSDVQAASTKAPRGIKNIIVMISDGCGYNHIVTTDYYTGTKQPYERFPVQTAMSTFEYEDQYQLDSSKNPTAVKTLMGYDPSLMWRSFDYSLAPMATDSASAATAMSSGVKTYNGALGVDINKNDVLLVTERAEALGKATGVITTVEWSHATPAGFVAHNESRNNYAAIAEEMIQSSGTDVIMGAGNPYFDDSGLPVVVPEATDAATTTTRAKRFQYVGGESTWNALVGGTAGGDANGDGTPDPWTLIQTSGQFATLADATITPDRVCGVAQVYTTLQQVRAGDGNADPFKVPMNSNVPSLATMAKGALNVLDKDPDGLFLMIEGGAVDWASHANQTGRLIEEEMDFNAAVDAVTKWVEKNSNWSETLLIVTGDHETGMLNGPGSKASGTFAPIVNNGKYRVPGVEWGSGDHTNQLIPLFAKGAGAHLVSSYVRVKDPVRGGYIDNTDVADLIFGLLK